jgi:hypothetical protein
MSSEEAMIYLGAHASSVLALPRACPVPNQQAGCLRHSFYIGIRGFAARCAEGLLTFRHERR